MRGIRRPRAAGRSSKAAQTKAEIKKEEGRRLAF